MTDEDTDPVVDDRVEMDLRLRVTALEDWRVAAEELLGLIGIGLLAMAAAATILTLMLRKRLA